VATGIRKAVISETKGERRTGVCITLVLFLCSYASGFREDILETVRKALVSPELKPQKATKRLERALFRYSQG
jgi:hypothetical protein